MKNHPQGDGKNHPQGGTKNHPYIIPVEGGGGWSGVCVCEVTEFRSLLERHCQAEWTTRTRLNGLLALQDFMLRSVVNGRFTISLDCSHGYVSPFKKPKSPDTIREPLAVLCEIGIWRKAQDAVNHHVTNSGIYALTDGYQKSRINVEINSPPGQKRRLEAAPERREKRLNRKYPWRAQLILDQGKLAFAPDALCEVSRLLSTTKQEATERALKAIVEGKHEEPWAHVTGTIYGSLNGIPKELKPLLTIDGELAAECDISHAHHCFLPVLLRERIAHCLGDDTRAGYVAQCRQELEALTVFLSAGDYYEKWCEDPADTHQREAVKNLATQLLNMRNESVRGIPLYRKMRAKFPCAYGVVEDIKQGDNRTISKRLQRYTADVIEAALLRAQALDIPAIPDTDALHVPERHRETVCELIGEEVFKATGGVCCKVGGIRYVPQGGNQAALPAAPQASIPAVVVLPDAPKAKVPTPRRDADSLTAELCNDPLVRLAARMFNAESVVEITTAEGRSYKVPLWR